MTAARLDDKPTLPAARRTQRIAVQIEAMAGQGAPPLRRSRSSIHVSLATSAFSLSILPGPVRAQTVNVQAKFSDAPEEGLSGLEDALVDWRTGNGKYPLLKAGLTGI